MEHTDVVILGAGMAGLTLARQLMLQTDKRVLHLEKRAQVPMSRQKVGESTVQIAGYYLGKVLDLEEYLFHQHFMKYNLRFMWGDGNDYYDYSQSYIRGFSNIPSYQLDRNRFEADLLTMNREWDRYQLITGAKVCDVTLEEGDKPHRVSWKLDGEEDSVTCDWVVDTTGRSRFMARKMDQSHPFEINHNASFFWVDGVVDLEKMTRTDRKEQRLHPSRRAMGHLPFWLATNHLMGEGFWFWVIPLRGRTSFGLVYDKTIISPDAVNRQDRLSAWLGERFPLLGDVLAAKEIIDFSTMNNFSHQCGNTIHRDRWAMSGESGRFSDPLYSPGGDLIAMHNTMITDAIQSTGNDLNLKTGLYESMCRSLFQSFLPSYGQSYRVLGDQESFAMKYVWELSIYFGFFVFPFINDLFTQPRFLAGYFRRLARLGDVNRNMQAYLTAFYKWKKSQGQEISEPNFFDFSAFETLRKAESTFYKIGVEPNEALRELDQQLSHLDELARYLITHMDSTVTGNPDLMHNANYIQNIDPETRTFSEAFTARAIGHESYSWSLNADLLNRSFPHKEACAV